MLSGEFGIPEKSATKFMKSLYKPLWGISDTIRDDMLNTANIQITVRFPDTWFAFSPFDREYHLNRQDNTNITFIF